MKRQLGVIAVVLAGIYSISQALVVLGDNAYVFTRVSPDTPENYVQLYGVLAAVVSLALLGVMLVIRRQNIAASLFDEDDIRVDLDAAALMRAALIVFGLSLLVGSAARVIFGVTNLISNLLIEGEFGDGFTAATYLQAAGVLLVGLLELALGLALVRRSGSIAKRLWAVPTLAPAPAPPAACRECGEPYDPDDYQDMTTARCVACGSPLAPPA